MQFDQFFSHLQRQYEKSSPICDYYYVTLPIYSRAEVTGVVANLGVRIFAILQLIRMNPVLSMH